MSKAKTAISPIRQTDFPEWYQQVIKAADLSESSPVRGCMIIKPKGYAIWENMQRTLDSQFKDKGVENAYFPLFIPLSFLEKEAEHVQGFAKECAVVTHHRLEATPEGGLMPAGALEEPLIVRPTSEMIIGNAFSKWIQSYRDLPLLINQWANVVRWEMRTRQFLRTSEFLWQEGHTAHSTDKEAIAMSRDMLDVYANFAHDYMAVPVIKGVKAAHERFPGAVDTFTIEAMMQDRKALQMGTSHFLGQNFSKAMNIDFQDEQGAHGFAWTTSWGVSTRLVGGMIMTHSDDNGLVLPPRLAPKPISIIPISKPENKDSVLTFCRNLKKQLSQQTYFGKSIDVWLDERDIRGGEKSWDHIKKGIPLRLEIGPRDIENNSLMLSRRDSEDPKAKQSVTTAGFLANCTTLLDSIHDTLFERAANHQQQNTKEINSLKELQEWFTPQNADKPEIHGGFAQAYVAQTPDLEASLKQLKLTHRCYPLEQDNSEGKCIFTGETLTQKSILAKAY